MRLWRALEGGEYPTPIYPQSYKDGLAKVKITQPGIWMVRVQHMAPEHTADYDRYVARAVLLFEVK